MTDQDPRPPEPSSDRPRDAGTDAGPRSPEGQGGQQPPPGWGQVPPPGAGGPNGPAGGRARPGSDPRVALLVIAGLALVAILVRTGHVQSFSIVVLGVLIVSVVLHEVSHGAVANLCGDDTAKRAGRLTLNPLAHVDVMGTIIVPAIMVASGFGAFGWAKPVPVNLSRLRHPRNQGLLVSLVGPGVNIALAAVGALVFRQVVPAADKTPYLLTGPLWVQVVFALGYVNVLLAVFNLIPLPPLDGSVLIERMLPASWLPRYYRIRPFAMVLPLALIVLSSFGGPGGDLLNRLFDPVLSWWARVVGA